MKSERNVMDLGYSALSAYGKLDAMDNPAWKEDVSRMMVV